MRLALAAMALAERSSPTDERTDEQILQPGQSAFEVLGIPPPWENVSQELIDGAYHAMSHAWRDREWVLPDGTPTTW